MRSHTRLLVLAAFLTLVLPVSASASPQSPAAKPQVAGVLVDDTGAAETWEGEVSSVGLPVRDIPECGRMYCDSARVSVDLPRSTWKRSGGLQIAIRWDGSTGGSLGMFVYRDGERVAASASNMGTAQSVTIPNAEDGEYDVYVRYGVARGTRTADPTIAYDGLAEVEYEPRARPRQDLLPDLVALPQENVTYSTPPRYFDDFAVAGSCFISERREEGAEQCLRFDQVLKNGGSGPVEIRFDRRVGHIGTEDVDQRIYRSDGSHYDVPSGQVEFHGVHDHYHFEGFAQSELWRLTDDGDLAHSSPAAVGDKVSFCITDTDLVNFGEKGDGPLSYPASDCLDPQETSEGIESFWYGLTPGWADRYGWYLPDQMIDTADLSDGRYVLFTRVDPEDKLRESDESNNCVAVVVDLSGLATSSPDASIVGDGPKCR